MGKLFGFLFVLLLLAGAGAVGGWFYLQHVYAEGGPATADGAPRVITVPKGARAADVAAKLLESGAIKDDLHFRTIVRVNDLLPGSEGDLALKAGEYAVPSGASMKDIIALLSSGKSLQYAVIIPEGLTTAMIMKLLAEKEWSSTTGAPQTYKLAGEPPPTPAEGVLLPGDYAVQRGDTIESVVTRAIKAQQDLLAELWPNRQPGLPLKTPEEAINLASVVENETGIPEERPQVASLFLNRLRKPMRLQSDPTVVYGISRGVPLGHGLRVSELARETPWNTYRIDGLPKTPISNPGRESIKAVLNPAVTNYLYFVADGSGGHAFASTLGEHNANVAKWREIEKQRNIQSTPKPAGAKPR
jgi:UPF0755 protein